MKRSYVFYGEPTAMKFKSLDRFQHANQKQQQTMMAIDLQEQHETNTLFDGPLLFDITFFMKMGSGNPKQGSYHSAKPNLRDLMHFYRSLCETILFEKDCIIAKESCMKVYDKSPRTFITIQELA
jgi:Holliday junction resolvase RusA-like endonuclease